MTLSASQTNKSATGGVSVAGGGRLKPPQNGFVAQSDIPGEGRIASL